MADFDVTAPDGRKFRVSAPEGASQQDVLAYAQAQFAKMPKPPQESMLETVAKAPARFTTGLGEAALSIGTGAAASAAGGLLGLANAGSPMGGDQAATVRNIQEAGTYQPRTEMGKKIISTVAAPFEALAGGADWAGKRATDAATALGASAPVAAGVGTAVNTGIQALPLALGPGGRAGGAALENTGRGLMQSALKPSGKSLDTGKAATAIQTMLDEGANVSPGGIQKLRGKIDELNTEILSAIQNSPAVVDKVKVAQELQGTLDKFSKQVNPRADMAAIEKAWTEFLETAKAKIPVAEAQQLKQGTYRALGDKSYGELKGADIEAQKALARGLKNEIAAAVPEVAGPNAAESKLLTALNIAEHRVLMDGNKNPLGLGSLITHPEMVPVWMADRSPLVKSLLARLAYSAGGELPAAGQAGAVTGAAMMGRPKRLQDLQK